MEREGSGDATCKWCARYGHQKIGTGIGGLGNKRTKGNHSNDSIIKIAENTEKGPGDLR